MIDPRTVLVAVPSYGGSMEAPTAGGLIACQGLYAALTTPDVSHPAVARNTVADGFLRSNFEWLVCIDNDIGFTRRDFEQLLQPIDPEALYHENYKANPEGLVELDGSGAPPVPTRIELPLCVANDSGRVDFNVKEPGPADVLVAAEYSYKNDTFEPVRFGMGFVRIHRSVFRTLEKLTHDGEQVHVRREVYEQLTQLQGADPWTSDDKVGVPRELLKRLKDTTDDPKGTPRLWQCSYKGNVFWDYYPSGAILSQYVVTAEWKGEDHGFFTLCMLAGIVPRIETRTRLTHYGRKGYEYLGPDQGGGQ